MLYLATYIGCSEMLQFIYFYMLYVVALYTRTVYHGSVND